MALHADVDLSIRLGSIDSIQADSSKVNRYRDWEKRREDQKQLDLRRLRFYGYLCTMRNLSIYHTYSSIQNRLRTLKICKAMTPKIMLAKHGWIQPESFMSVVKGK